MRQLNRRTARGRRGGGRSLGGRPPGPGGRAGRDAFLESLGEDGIALAGTVLILVLVLGAFVLGALRVPQRLGVWVAALAVLLIVASGLLYAFRLRASGPAG